jgi:hypothetical protein
MGECFLDRWLDPLCEKSVQVTVSSAVRKASILNYSLIYVKKAECYPYADNKNRKKTLNKYIKKKKKKTLSEE